MAWDYTKVNQLPATGSIAIWDLISRLVAAGWTQRGSGDATTWDNDTFPGTGGHAGPVASGASGVGGLANNNAWVRLQMPTDSNGKTRELCIQRSTDNLNWSFHYSYHAGFITGGGAAAHPTAADSQDPYTNPSTIFDADNTYRCHVVVGGAAEGYSYYLVTQLSPAGGNARGTIFHDAMLSGSYPAEDYDPHVWMHHGPSLGVAWAFAIHASESSGAAGFQGKLVGGGGSWVRYGLAYPYDSSGSLVAAIGANPHSTKHDAMPAFWARRTATSGWKGQSTLFRWKGSAHASGSGGNFDGGTNNAMCQGDCWVTFSGAVLV